jgi:peptidylprolyl isomerase
MTVKVGDKVAVHYTGWLEDGQKFDSSLDSGETFKFHVGKGMVIKGFDDAVLGMNVGDKKKFDISPVDGYGEKSEKNIFTVARDMFPADAEVTKGAVFEMHGDQGQVIPVIVDDENEKEVSIDANHPLAGKILTFEIELMETGVDIPDFNETDGCGCGCGGDHDCGDGGCC